MPVAQAAPSHEQFASGQGQQAQAPSGAGPIPWHQIGTALWVIVALLGVLVVIAIVNLATRTSV